MGGKAWLICAISCSCIPIGLANNWPRRLAVRDPWFTNGVAALQKPHQTIPPSCSLVHVLLTITLLASMSRSKSVSSRFVRNRKTGMSRTPGPVAILSYLQRDQQLKASGKPLSCSTRTIWLILDAAGLIERDPLRKRSGHKPPEPLEEVQVDLKEVSTVPTDLHDPDAKQAHRIETCNFIDAGTSTLLDAQVHEDLHAETAFLAVVAFLQHDGCPRMLTFDRDPALGWQCHGTRFSLGFVPISVLCRRATQYLATSQRRMLAGAPSGHARRGSYGDRSLCTTLQSRATASRSQLWQSATSRRTSRPATLRLQGGQCL
jgi:hypothetical protein